MQYTHFIGIDISKLTFDAFIRGTDLHRQFRNDEAGFKSLLSWLAKYATKDLQSVTVVFEHTGLYSLPLAIFLERSSVPYSMISALEIKRSLGIVRGKNDTVDSKRIAEYAYLFRESLVETTLPPNAILKLQPLLTMRDKIVRNVSGYKVTRKELRRYLNRDELPALFEAYDKLILAMNAEVKTIERAIQQIIQSDPELKLVYELVTGIKGVGFVVAVYMIVATHNFTRFDNWRQFACYAGIAPFEFQSGTSVRGKTRVSSIAHKQMKKMLHLAGLSAALTDPEMNQYYLRRIQEGKSKMGTINIVRNKVLARIFAVVKRKTPYVNIRQYAIA